MAKHTVKFEYDNGEKLEFPVLWCGISNNGGRWNFQDAQHLALSAGGSIQPCKNCIKAIIKELEREL